MTLSRRDLIQGGLLMTGAFAVTAVAGAQTAEKLSAQTSIPDRVNWRRNQ